MAQSVTAPLPLAFVGDAVYGLYMRKRLAEEEPAKVNELHQRASHFVCAKAQFLAMQHIMPLLTDKENAVFRRGRNAKAGTVPKHAEVIHYRHATGLEALMGYLYLEKETDRLEFLLGKVFDFLNDEVC